VIPDGEKPAGSGRPLLAVFVGALLGILPSAFIYYGVGRGSDWGKGSLALAALAWAVTAVATAWRLYRKGWRA
jgi:hypothetical protein